MAVNQSHIMQYFPNVKFRTYFHFNFAFVMAAVNALFMLTYIQHLYVIKVKHPKSPQHDMLYTSNHMEISLEVYGARMSRQGLMEVRKDQAAGV